MTAVLLTALFVTVAVASALTLADAFARSRNAVRLLRGDLARIASQRRVTVWFESDSAQRMPALRPSAVTAGRHARRPVRAPERLRAAA